MSKICKEVYWNLVDNFEVTRPHIQKWSDIISEDLDSQSWSSFFSVNFQCPMEVKMRAFQYQILMRSIPTNKYLKICKIKDNDDCYFCKISIESIEHLFWNCPIVKTFWYSLAYTLGDVFDLNLLTLKTVMLGYIGMQNRNLINHILNITKRYIYVTKCKEEELNLHRLINLIKYHYKLEKNIVEFNRGNEICWYKKWEPIKGIVCC